jgi:hypothetical protein
VNRLDRRFDLAERAYELRKQDRFAEAAKLMRAAIVLADGLPLADDTHVLMRACLTECYIALQLWAKAEAAARSMLPFCLKITGDDNSVKLHYPRIALALTLAKQKKFVEADAVADMAMHAIRCAALEFGSDIPEDLASRMEHMQVLYRDIDRQRME